LALQCTHSYAYNYHVFVYCKDLTNDLKGVTRHILALKHSLETDMTLKLLADNEDNTKFWNERYQRDVDATGTPPSWFKTQWLYAECYCYRLIHDAFAQR